MSLFERIKNIRRSNLQEEKIKFPGGTGDIGFTAPKRGEKVQKRLDRADKLGTPDPFDPDYDKKVKKVDGRSKIGKVFKSTKPVTTSAPDFGKGDTPGETRVKGLEKKAFKKTQPSDVKLPKSFRDFESNLRDYKDKDKATMRTGKSSSKVKVTGANNLSRQDVGMAPPNTPKKSKGVKQSEVSKKAKDFTKLVNQKRVIKGDGKVTNSKGIGNKYRGNSPEAKALRQQAIDARRGKGVVVKDKVTMSNRVNKGFTTPAKTTGPTLPPFVKKRKVITGVTATGRPSTAKLPSIKDSSLGRAVSKEYARNPKSPLLKRQNLRYLKAASKQKGLAKGIISGLGRLGPKGRLAAGGITAFLATPFARNLAIGTGLTAALGLGRKKEKVLKKGDGLKTVGKVDVRYGLTGSKTNKDGKIIKSGGKIYDPKQMAQLGKVQKNFIDKYNQKAARNPFKKQIQYKPKADGTYKILDPKKK